MQTQDMAGASPIGGIMAFSGINAPENWLLCDGSIFDASVYPDLLTVLGTQNLPDLRGQFLRGFDPAGVVDPDGSERSVLSAQSDAYKSHKHGIWVSHSGDETSNSIGAPMLGNTRIIYHDELQSTKSTLQYSSVGNPMKNSGDLETRPKNMAVNFIIRAK